MKERPILMTPANAQKCYEGTKTQTRRIVKERNPYVYVEPHCDEHGAVVLAMDKEGDYYKYCPYGQVGDRLWVREAWAWPGEEEYLYKGRPADVQLVTEWQKDLNCCQVKWMPSIYMPRQACRTVLEITNIRVERLQEISEEDAIAEGVTCLGGVNGTYDRDDFSGCWTNYSSTETAAYWNSPIDSYHSLWDSINGVGSWMLNPWVWVLEFRRSQS